MSRHLHVTHASASGSVHEVNTFDRALVRLGVEVRLLQPVIHYGRGRPSFGLAAADGGDLLGRRLAQVVSPAVGVEGPYLQSITVLAADVYLDASPPAEAEEFLDALDAYRREDTDENWDRANSALQVWHQAIVARPLIRGDVIAALKHPAWAESRDAVSSGP